MAENDQIAKMSKIVKDLTTTLNDTQSKIVLTNLLTDIVRVASDDTMKAVFELVDEHYQSNQTKRYRMTGYVCPKCGKFLREDELEWENNLPFCKEHGTQLSHGKY